jgi:acylphosphatase
VKAVEVRVHGRVQGVLFRASTRIEAQRLGLTGWVRNRSDGTVQARLQGDPGAVEAMVAWCRCGPPGADVTRLDLEDAEVDGTLSDFRIR